MNKDKVIEFDEEAYNIRINVEAEKRIKTNKMENGISYEECSDRFLNVVSLYSSRELKAWNYFVSIYDDMPQEHRLKIMLKDIYTYYHFDMLEFYQYLKRILDDETLEQQKIRTKENKKMLKGYLDKKNFIKLYRGVTNNSLEEELAISYTVDKSKAEWFANRFQSEYKEVIETESHLNQILLYTNDREEKEVIIIPNCLENLEDYFDMERK